MLCDSTQLRNSINHYRVSFKFVCTKKNILMFSWDVNSINIYQ